jgi:hypothetical protein
MISSGFSFGFGGFQNCGNLGATRTRRESAVASSRHQELAFGFISRSICLHGGKDIFPFEARKRFEKGVPLKAFPTASKKSLFLEDAAGGRGGGDPFPQKRSRSLISPPCRAGGMRRARERPEFGPVREGDLPGWQARERRNLGKPAPAGAALPDRFVFWQRRFTKAH